MRITGGTWRSRRLKSLGGQAVRPTQGRVREALFSMVHDDLPGSLFVDLCAGTGMVGIDALSRGARRVVWVERDRRAWNVLRDNVAALGGDVRDVVREDAWRWPSRAGAGLRADIAFADPPYTRAGTDPLDVLMTSLRDNGCIRSGGLLIAETARDATPAPIDGLTEWRTRVYGQTRLTIWRVS